MCVCCVCVRSECECVCGEEREECVCVRESVCVCVCACVCAGGSVVKLQEIRKLSPDQRLREKRAESCEPRRSVHQQGRRDMLHRAKPGALTEVFYFHVSVLRIRLRQI